MAKSLVNSNHGNIRYIVPMPIYQVIRGLSWSWSYDSWIYNFLCNQCLLPHKLWNWIYLMARCTTLYDQVCQWLTTGQWLSRNRIYLMARCTTLYDQVCQWLTTGQWLSQGTLVPSTNKTDHHNISETLLKVALNIIILNPPIPMLWIVSLVHYSTLHCTIDILPGALFTVFFLISFIKKKVNFKENITCNVPNIYENNNDTFCQVSII